MQTVEAARERRRIYTAAWRKRPRAQELRKQWLVKNRLKTNTLAAEARLRPHSRARAMWHTARYRAARKGWEFNLTVEWIERAICAGTCPRTGIKFDLAPALTTSQNPFSPSLDRRDPTKGYTQDNVDVVVTALNMARSDWGDGVYATVARAFLKQNPKTE